MKVGHLYQQIISIEHLFQAWDEFKKEKRAKFDVQKFEINLENNLFKLHQELACKTYQHGTYSAFNIYDPKFRHIHKAFVRDRVVHHAIVSVIEPIFDRTFIFDSYSCRKDKGMHRAVKRLTVFTRKVSKNYNDQCFVLKLDIKKFFASVDHKILLELLKKKIEDEDLIWFLEEVISSFHSNQGIPIGNLTSQIFANIYLNELDKFIKEGLQVKYYIRYADDFIIASTNEEYLKVLIPQIDQFLKKNLKLALHENKIVIRKLSQGIDFLGYIVLPHYVLPRTKTKRRLLKRLNGGNLPSYLGYLSHANTYNLRREIASLRSLPRTLLRGSSQ